LNETQKKWYWKKVEEKERIKKEKQEVEECEFVEEIDR